MIEANTLFLTFSLIFILAFFGNLFFKKTRFSDITILLIIGFLLSTVFNVITAEQVALLRSMSSIFGTLALILLLFDGGLHLNFYNVLNKIGKATFFTLVVFILTVALCTLSFYYIFSIPWLYGLLIGTAIGGTSSAVIIPLVMASKSKDETKTLLILESAITDLFCIIIFITVFEIIVSQTSNVQHITQGIMSSFAIATVIGVFASILWTKILRDFKVTENFFYLLTISFVFITYVAIEYLKGSGAFGILIFGLILGNSKEILKIFKMKPLSDSNIRSIKDVYKFHSEISLFIKAFFFIYLGIIIDVSEVTLIIVLMSLLSVIIIFVSRYFSTYLFSKDKIIKEDKNHIISLHARGLSAAVLATYPVSMGLVTKESLIILPVVFLIIFITNITTTIMFFLAERKKKQEQDEMDQEFEKIKNKIVSVE